MGQLTQLKVFCGLAQNVVSEQTTPAKTLADRQYRKRLATLYFKFQCYIYFPSDAAGSDKSVKELY